MRVQKVDNKNSRTGFRGSDIDYYKKADQRYESRIWKCLLGVALLVFSFTLWIHIREIQVIHSGNVIECTYYVDSKGIENAYYYDIDDKLYTFKLATQNSVHSDDSITMYYMDNISDAIPKTSTIIWLGYYTFFGIMAAICIWRIRVIYSK